MIRDPGNVSTSEYSNPSEAGLKIQLTTYAQRLSAWLLDSAFDLWWGKGADEAGGFYERIAQDGQPMRSDNRRARVQPRQVYCYSVAGEMGWLGPWPTAVKHGLSWFEKTYARSDGLYGNVANDSGVLIDPSFDLYNHSFAIMGLAAAAGSMPDEAVRYHGLALGILEKLRAYYRHPLAGFEESAPPREPLCSNPHMHMLEAALTWENVAPSEVKWKDLADEIACLAMRHMIDSETGSLREFFDRDWRPLPGQRGRIVEPGHQFEWAWLLTVWGGRRRSGEALVKARRLFEIGERHGVCPHRHVAIMSLYDDFSVHSDLSRLWLQTEWLKAALILASHSHGEDRLAYMHSAVKALQALFLFIETPVLGLWYDKWFVEEGIVTEPAPASTFYHIVCACKELRKFV